MTEPFRTIPSVHALLAGLGEAGATPLATTAARRALARVRASVAAGGAVPPVEAIAADVRSELAGLSRLPLRPLVNATGVILQTNLGRAPLSERALTAIAETAAGYSNLEYKVEPGERGSRHSHLRDLIRRLTGAEDGIVVNNNAAGLLMVLQVLAPGREVILSRGQAVEIGGGFRVPDVIRQSGVRLVEVGTTNRTYARDYEAAAGAETAAILRVHASNFRVVGFVHEPALGELVEVARRCGILLLDDLGSGCLIETERFGLVHEPTVQESIAGGADLALFSGDKLLGGPQAGIIAGRADLVERLRRHPLARALRVDKLTIAALAATLQSYAEGRAAAEIPVWRMASLPAAGVRRRARRWAAAAGPGGAVVAGRTMLGGGSLPGEGLPTWCAALAAPEGADRLAARLRAHEPPVLGRIDEGRLLLDPRTVLPAHDRIVEAAIRRALA